MTKFTRYFAFILGIMMLNGCATLQTDYKTPEVSVTSFRALPSEGVSPRFEIGLHVINPNRSELSINGIVYSVKIEGHKILTGAANDLPVIEGYGEGDVTLQATADLFNSINLIADLMSQPRDTFTYDLDVDLDIGDFLPMIHVEKTGKIALHTTR